MSFSGAHDDLLDAAAAVPQLRRLLEGLSSGKDPVVLGDVSEQSWPFLGAALARLLGGEHTVWFVCNDARAQEEFASELASWISGATLFPDIGTPVTGLGLPDPEIASERLAVLGRLARGEIMAIVLNSSQLVDPVPSLTDMTNALLCLTKGWLGSPGAVVSRLAEAGYERVSQVIRRGEFALRGGILDIFSWQQPMPVRLEFDEDGITSMREFDCDTQSSVGEIDLCEVQLGDPDKVSMTLESYLDPDDLLVEVGWEPAESVNIKNAGIDGSLKKQPEIIGNKYVSRSIRISSFPIPELKEVVAFDPIPFAAFGAGDFVVDEARRQEFFKQLASWHNEGWHLVLLSATEGEGERFRELAASAFIGKEGFVPETRIGAIARGFSFPLGRLAVLADAEIFGRSATQRLRRLHLGRERQKAARSAIDFTEFSEGDLVVHSDHGIGLFLGLQKITATREAEGVEGLKSEVLALEFARGSRLFVPIDQSWKVSRYVGVGKHSPDLSILGDEKWTRTRRAAEKSVFLYAGQLLKLQAERETGNGHPFGADTPWQRELEQSFQYRETSDQLRAIAEIKQDMESRRVMDRLLCGDVGFGKTEVALRAAFKALMGGRQVVFLAPTTVLAQQHERTLRERMSEYPVRIELLSRYRSATEQRAILKGLAEGTVDLVVGTHRLLSPDVKFKNLGLVIVDEEQRFGVKHKEAFKDQFRLVDVLTLSATPIPRTLYLSLMGARDMSVIETPPPDRQPVETVICAYDERIIRDAIQRECARGGQVYFLHNRIGTIQKVATRLSELCPNVRVIIGHGRMEEGELEEVMKRFVEGQAEVLVSTTIIESGLDIPNANTIIIDRADRFGLADLYQLRGRVGRSHQKAYAYLMLPRDMMMAGEARRRVQAIRQYSQLGAGFRIAMRDLEIRGAGNLLGTAQSGHIAAVGFDLYCRMLRQAVDRMKRRPDEDSLPEENQTVMRLDFIAQSSEELIRSSAKCPEDENKKIARCGAFIPLHYLPDAKLRIEAYRSLASARDGSALEALAASWRDRFGPFPKEVNHLLITERIRYTAGLKGITIVETRGDRLMLTRRGDFLLLGHRFPRLTTTKPASKLSEVLRFLEALQL